MAYSFKNTVPRYWIVFDDLIPQKTANNERQLVTTQLRAAKN